MERLAPSPFGILVKAVRLTFDTGRVLAGDAPPSWGHKEPMGLLGKAGFEVLNAGMLLQDMPPPGDEERARLALLDKAGWALARVREDAQHLPGTPDERSVSLADYAESLRRHFDPDDEQAQEYVDRLAQNHLKSPRAHLLSSAEAYTRYLRSVRYVLGSPVTPE